MNNWEKCLVKGDLGELLITSYLKERGYTIYSPLEKGSHPIDRLIIKDLKVVAFDIKCKNKRDKYDSTGYDYADHKKYLELNKKADVWIFFVDDKLGNIYCQSLDKLITFVSADDGTGNIKSHPFVEPAMNHETGLIRNVIYFHMSQLIKVCSIPEKYLTKLRSLKEK